MDQLPKETVCKKYVIQQRNDSYFIATLADGEQETLFKVHTIDMKRVKRATSRDNIVNKLHIYRGLHLLPCMSRLNSMFIDNGVLHMEQVISHNGMLENEIQSCINYQICISEESIKMWLTQVAIALDALHKRKIIHGCVKTHNLFLQDNKNIVHLGPTEELLQLHVRPRALNHEISVYKTTRAELREKSARFREDGRDVASLEYIAPELLNPNNDVNFSNDIWCLGIVAYKLARLQVPFRGNSPLEVTMAIEEQPVDFSSIKKRGYSDVFIALLEKMLNKDPSQRLTAKAILSYQFLPCKMHFGD